MQQQLSTLDWNDTFLDEDHLKASFPDHKVVIEKPENYDGPTKPPYRLGSAPTHTDSNRSVTSIYHIPFTA